MWRSDGVTTPSRPGKTIARRSPSSSGWGSRNGRRALAAVSLAWAGDILYGTLATKQHWFADLPAAFVLAFAAHRLAWRGEEGSRAPAPADALSRFP